METPYGVSTSGPTVLPRQWSQGPHTGVFGGTVGADPPAQSAARGQPALRCLWRPCAVRRPPARQEVLGGGRAGSPVGLISSLLTNPFIHEQAERDGARHEASQHRSSPATAVSLLGRASVSVAAGTPRGAHLPKPSGWAGELPPTRATAPPQAAPHSPSARSSTPQGSRTEPGKAPLASVPSPFSPGLKITSVTVLKPLRPCRHPSGVRALWHRSRSTA